MTDARGGRVWTYAQALVAPLAIWALLGGGLLLWNTEDRYDRAALQEWLEEARTPDATLPDLARQYVERVREHARVRHDRANGEQAIGAIDARIRANVKREEIAEHLKALAEPATKIYPGLLPLFPVVYRLEVRFLSTAWAGVQPDDAEGPPLSRPVAWDSGQEPAAGRYQSAVFPLGDVGEVEIHYQLHAWNKRQRDEQWRGRGLVLVVLLGAAATGLGLAWLMLAHDRESRQERTQRLAQYQLDQAERQLLQETARRAETERALLEQQMATEEARRKALELETNLAANIAIMAGSYAHNIKNLLVRPNDLLRRCLESDEAGPAVRRMVHEVEQTLGLVTDRLQQILQTVRRGPANAEPKDVDLGELARGVGATWGEVAADRWQVDLVVEAAGPASVRGDESHLQQAVENLLFNARDATFERRNQLREAARAGPAVGRRQALLDAAGWRGRVVLRVGPGPVLEVTDNGAGMSDAVRQRCTEAHFTTKRDNALYEGLSTGMGLGLSFVASILDNHRGTMEIDSQPGRGATFRLRFPDGAADA